MYISTQVFGDFSALSETKKQNVITTLASLFLSVYLRLSAITAESNARNAPNESQTGPTLPQDLSKYARENSF